MPQSHAKTAKTQKCAVAKVPLVKTTTFNNDTLLNISGQVDTPLLVGKGEGVTLMPVVYILTP